MPVLTRCAGRAFHLKSVISQHIRRTICIPSDSDSMDLNKVVGRLQQYAPPSLAADWDNTGLLVEPSAPHCVNTILLTNDLTEPVLQEAIETKAHLILSYHPPVFVPLKRVTQGSWKERVVARCLERRIAVYSPHTSCDSIRNGVNDWLVQPFSGHLEPLQPAETGGPPFCAEFTVGAADADRVAADTNKLAGVTVMHRVVTAAPGGVLLSARCSAAGLTRLTSHAASLGASLHLSRLEKVPSLDQGAGRLVTLDEPCTVGEAVRRIKYHLKLAHVRLALAQGATTDSSVGRVAVCAGSGASVLAGVSADLYLTGEMSHHEVLDATHKGRSVILCDHSNTERGWLDHVLRPALTDLLEHKVEVVVSAVDADPLVIV